MSNASSRRGKVSPEHVAESERLSAIWNATYEVRKEKGLHSQGVFGAEYDIGNQAAVGFFLNGKAAISLKAAKGFAKGLNCRIADFSPRLAAEIRALAQGTGITQPAMVVTASSHHSHSERPTRPGLLRGLGDAFNSVLKPYGQLRRHGQIYDGGTADMTLIDSKNQVLAAIECKTYDLAERSPPNLSALTGRLWMMRHELHGPNAVNLPMFLVFLVENASVTQEANETEQNLHQTAAFLQKNGLLNGFTIMRVHDKEDGQTELHDLPKASETLQNLMESVKQTAANLKQ
jgi:hypothetical protein